MKLTTDKVIFDFCKDNKPAAEVIAPANRRNRYAYEFGGKRGDMSDR